MENGKWYSVTKPGYICASGTPYYGAFRPGSENCLMVHLDGGGASWNEFTAKRPVELYADRLEQLSAMDERGGIYILEESNPFRDWNIVNVCYATADFHVGNSEFIYTDDTGEKKILHHCGYRNFRMVMEQVKEYVPEPERLLICGESAGGFGVAALAGVIREMFPGCTDVTCLVDGARINSELRPVIRNLWKAEEQFYEPVCSNNAVADWMCSLYQKYGNQMKYLFICSTRDWVLSFFQDVFDHEVLHYTRESGLGFQQNLKQMCERLQREVPGIGICIYDFPAAEVPRDTELTQHTILMDNSVYAKLRTQDITAVQWIRDAMEGNIRSYGLELL